MRPGAPFLARTKIELCGKYFDVVNRNRPAKPNLGFTIWPSYPGRSHDIVSINALSLKGMTLRPSRPIRVDYLIRICTRGIRSHPENTPSTTVHSSLARLSLPIDPHLRTGEESISTTCCITSKLYMPMCPYPPHMYESGSLKIRLSLRCPAKYRPINFARTRPVG